MRVRAFCSCLEVADYSSRRVSRGSRRSATTTTPRMAWSAAAAADRAAPASLRSRLALGSRGGSRSDSAPRTTRAELPVARWHRAREPSPRLPLVIWAWNSRSSSEASRAPAKFAARVALRHPGCSGWLRLRGCDHRRDVRAGVHDDHGLRHAAPSCAGPLPASKVGGGASLGTGMLPPAAWLRLPLARHSHWRQPAARAGVRAGAHAVPGARRRVADRARAAARSADPRAARHASHHAARRAAAREAPRSRLCSPPALRPGSR